MLEALVAAGTAAAGASAPTVPLWLQPPFNDLVTRQCICMRVQSCAKCLRSYTRCLFLPNKTGDGIASSVHRRVACVRCSARSLLLLLLDWLCRLRCFRLGACCCRLLLLPQRRGHQGVPGLLLLLAGC